VAENVLSFQFMFSECSAINIYEACECSVVGVLRQQHRVGVEETEGIEMLPNLQSALLRQCTALEVLKWCHCHVCTLTFLSLLM
jgi:hypothetical protein